MEEFKVGDQVKVDGKIGKIVYYNNFVYTVEIGKEQSLRGKGELEKLSQGGS